MVAVKGSYLLPLAVPGGVFFAHGIDRIARPLRSPVLLLSAAAALAAAVIFSEGLVQGLENTFQVERSRFDKILLDHAAELGAHVFEETTAKSIEVQGERTAVTLSHRGEERVVSARWILDGSGRENAFTCDLKRKFDPPRLGKRLAIYTHFRDVPRAEGYAAGGRRS